MSNNVNIIMRCLVLLQIFRKKGKGIREEREEKREREGQNYETKIRRRKCIRAKCIVMLSFTMRIDFRDGGHCTGYLAFDDPENDLERVNRESVWVKLHRSQPAKCPFVEFLSLLRLQDFKTSDFK